MLGKFGAGQRLSHGVVTDVGELTKTVEQAERQQNGSVDADADVGAAGLDPLQGQAGGEGALGDDRHGQPAAPTGIVNVRSELT